MKKTTTSFSNLFLLAISTLLLITSCGTARRGEPVFGKMEERNEKVNMGEIVFMNDCQKCHPGGESGVGPSINNIPIPGIALRFRVRSKAFLLGVGRMPSFKQHEISKKEMDSLIAYLHALKRNDEDAREKTYTKK
jgi:mono/diheme cytochrome c family protein